MALKIFRRDIYRSHPTIKVAQYYYFLRVTLVIFAAQGHDILRSVLNEMQEHVAQRCCEQRFIVYE